MARRKTSGNEKTSVAERRSLIKPPSPFGVHQDPENGSWWLLQKERGMSAVGLPMRQCPFLTGAKGECPHNFYLTGQKPMDMFLSDFSIMMQTSAQPLVSHCLPTGAPPSKIMVVTVHISKWMSIHNLHQLSCPTQSMVTSMADQNMLKKVMTAGMSNLGHLLIAGVTGSNANKLHDIIRQALISRTKVTLLTDETPTLVGFAGHYKAVSPDQQLWNFMQRWEDKAPQFPIMGDYYLFNKMREIPVIHDG